MRLKGLNEIFERGQNFRELLKNINEGKTPCQVHGLSESQKAYLSYCLFESIDRSLLLLSHNDIEAKKLFDDLKVFTDDAAYFPSKEMVFNIDVTSGDIKNSRLQIINHLSMKKKILVVASVDSCFFKMAPQNIFKEAAFELFEGGTFENDNLLHKLYNLGYERVSVVEGMGQFSLRGGIVDIYPPFLELPVRIEFFGDEIDTIRSFDILTQRSFDRLKKVMIFPVREVLLDDERLLHFKEALRDELNEYLKGIKKNNRETAEKLKIRVNENIEKLENLRYFEGIESFIGKIYKGSECFLDYFKGCPIVLDEVGRITQRIDTAFEEFSETFKSLLEKGDLLNSQGEYMYSNSYIKERLNGEKLIALNMLPRAIPDFNIKSLINFNTISTNPLSGNLNLMLDEIKEKIRKNYFIVLFAGNRTRCERLAVSLKDEGINSIYSESLSDLKERIVYTTEGSLSHGMEFPDIKLSVLTDRDVHVGKRVIKEGKKARKLESFTDLKAGDFVVHVNHGIGVFKGIKELSIEGIKRDYLVLNYQGGDTLYVPVEQLDMVQKYIGSEENAPKVNKLGGTDWLKTKKKVKESLKDMANELIELYAKRSLARGHAYPADTVWQKQFEEEFPYEETRDQLLAIEEIKADMQNEKPMDRLLCGDVGYGKTEVAMRAAFKAIMDGKQVALLVPTTILAEQHYNNFKQRFGDFPVNIDMISRFRNANQQKKTLKDLTAGNVDVVIGTHRLLQKDVKYKDLGLLIVDEEQKFGVSHKEKIKELKKNIDVLTLSATPIPRTLHMSMVGVRDMSLIETPPQERYPVQTYVMEYNDGIIRDAVLREMSRGGQVFFVYNRVETIDDIKAKLSNLIPEARIMVGHGQMDEKILENVIVGFIKGEGDILLCTTIIESGIDMPNVNTLIVFDADKMGLSQLYQLRGRVGRSSRLAYAYFTYRKDKVLTEIAEKRLKAIKEFTEFGSGFKIAMRDLEIRGAGNLLGRQQHGHMASVGYDLYCKLLEEAVRELKGEQASDYIETAIDLNISAYIPDDYINDEMIKIEVYKKIAAISSDDDKMDVEDEIIDRFGDIPEEVINLINIASLKMEAKSLKITSIKQIESDILINFSNLEYIGVESIRDLNKKFNGIISYGSTKQPILKVKVKNVKTEDLISLLKDIIVSLGGLHNLSK